MIKIDASARRRLSMFLPLLLLSTAAGAEPACEPAVKVARSVFTHQIAHREPVGRLRTIDPEQPHLFFFTELLAEHPAEVVHRWELDGESLGSPTLQVGTPRWRTWSRVPVSSLLPGLVVVSVLDEKGCVVHTAELRVGDPQPPAAAEPAASEAPSTEGGAEAATLAAQRAKAKELLERAVAARHGEAFDEAEQLLEQALTLMPRESSERTAALDELRYHLPLAEARWHLRQQDAESMRVALDPIRAYLEDHPRRLDYRRALDNYYSALNRLEREN